MKREVKVFGTNCVSGGIIGSVARRYGYMGSHNQFRVICKATGAHNANTICKEIGFPYDIFNSKFTSETGNKFELELCEKELAWVCIDGTSGKRYMPLYQIMREYLDGGF